MYDFMMSAYVGSTLCGIFRGTPKVTHDTLSLVALLCKIHDRFVMQRSAYNNIVMKMDT